MSDIHFIITGGTLDKHYDLVTQINQMNAASVLPRYFETIIRPHMDVTFETICLLDSTDITPDIRDQILTAVQNAPSDRIVITHGTDKMSEAAQFLSGKTPPDKTVILTGSMIPMKEFAMSDAGFNLGYALAQEESLTAGVYLCMHGKTFAPDAVKKDTKAARFIKATS
jgi:L-asparaginase